jgi:hypothetical protein
MVPIVVFDQIYSFDRDALIKAIPPPEKISPEDFGPAAAELFDRIMQVTDNAGATDEHRALNYLAVRYPPIYAKAAEEFGRDYSLTGVEVRPSPLSSTRNIVDVIFSYTNRNTDFTEKFCVRVDVTEEFPYLVTKLSPYYDGFTAEASIYRSSQSYATLPSSTPTTSRASVLPSLWVVCDRGWETCATGSTLEGTLGLFSAFGLGDAGEVAGGSSGVPGQPCYDACVNDARLRCEDFYPHRSAELRRCYSLVAADCKVACF